MKQRNWPKEALLVSGEAGIQPPPCAVLVFAFASFFRFTVKGWRGQLGCAPLRGQEAIPEWCGRVSGMGAVARVTKATFGDTCHMCTPTLVARCVCVCKQTWPVGDKLLWYAQDSPRMPSVPRSV